MLKAIILILSLVISISSSAQESPPLSVPAATLPASMPTTSLPAVSWQMSFRKAYPNYTVEVWKKVNPDLAFGIEESVAKIFSNDGRLMKQMSNLILEADPSVFIENYKMIPLLDLDGDGNEDLMLRGYSGGAHCCYQYNVFSLGRNFKELGNLDLQDCGETIKVKDLNNDKLQELISCMANFSRMKQIPFSVSPFPPRVLSLKNSQYVDANKQFSQVYEEDIKIQKKEIAKEGYDLYSVLQLTLDQLLLGKDAQAWKEFDTYYSPANKEKVKAELLEQWNAYKAVQGTKP